MLTYPPQLDIYNNNAHNDHNQLLTGNYFAPLGGGQNTVMCMCKCLHICEHIVMYADDILLLSPSDTLLQKLLHICECELASLDMSINFSKSCCIRIGPHCDRTCISVKSLSGHCLPWNTEMHYLGVYIVQSRNMKCSLDACKRSFYQAANSIFGKIGKIASEEVVLHLISTKCIPILVYGLESF